MSHRQQTYSIPQSASGLAEDELIQRCQRGDRVAFNLFVQRYQDKVFSYLSFASKNSAAADLTRHVFVAAYRQFPRYTDAMPLHAWLFGIAERCLQQETRSRLPWYRRLLSPRPREASDDISAPTQSVKQPDSCEAIRDMLQEYHDGELNELDAKRVEKHLQRCSECWQEFDELQETIMLLQTVGRKHAPAELRPQINEALDRLASSFKWRALFQSVPALQLTSAVSLMLAIFSSAYLYLHSPDKGIDDDRWFRESNPDRTAPLSTRQATRTTQSLRGGKTATFVLIAGSERTLSDLPTLTTLMQEYDIPYNDNTVEIIYRPGSNAAGSFTEIFDRIQDMRGHILDTITLTKQPAFIQKMTAELPGDPLLSAFEELRTTTSQPTASPSDANRQITFYLIELQ